MTASVDQSTSSLSVSVSANQNGVAGKSSIYLELDGKVSPPIAVDATANVVIIFILFKIMLQGIR